MEKIKIQFNDCPNDLMTVVNVKNYEVTRDFLIIDMIEEGKEKRQYFTTTTIKFLEVTNINE